MCRYYMQHLGGLARVRKFITISTPHNGTLLAYGLSNKGALQMRPNSKFLNELRRCSHQLESVDPVTIWTPFDLMIVPPGSSRMPGWKDVRLPVIFHPWMLRDRKSIEVVVGILKEMRGSAQ